ncbi:hypothetical protein MMC21_003174 [Puttea exsequens]|nr:hypothetical protein [Puttea exsequens]
MVSQPSTIASIAYNNGGCALSQDQYLFAHLITGPESQYLQLRHPELDPNDVPIVEAAAKAGFDCSSWPNLNGLITAVPCKPGLYAGRWSADPTKLRKGWLRSYRDVDQPVDVLAFVVSAKQIYENLNNLPQGKYEYSQQTRRYRALAISTPGVSKMAGVGSNTIPPGPQTASKRPTSDNLVDFSSSSPKRLKIELPPSQPPTKSQENQPP